MFLREVISLILVVVIVLPVPYLSLENVATGQNAPFTGNIVSMEIDNMDINQVFKIFSDTSGWTIIASGKIKGKVSIWLKNISVEEALEKLVEVNGWAYVREGHIVTVMTREEYQELYHVQKNFLLKHARAEHLEKILKPMITGRTGKLFSDKDTNQLIVVDEPKKVDEIARLVEKLDNQRNVRVFQLSFANAEEVARRLREAFGGKSGESGNMFVADARTNQLIAYTTEENLNNIEGLINKLDNQRNIHVFQLSFANAEDVAAKLRESFGGKAEKAGSMFTADARTNQLVVFKTESNIQHIADLVEKFDVDIGILFKHLNYAKAEEVKSKLVELVGIPKENIQIDNRTTDITITAVKEKLEKAGKLIDEWDKPTKQVLIEAAILLVSVEKMQELGIKWE